MDRNLLLTVLSLVLLVLLGLHVTDDTVHRFDTVSPWNLIGIAVAGLLLYGTLVLRRRLSGHIIMLLISVFAFGMPVVHLRGTGIQEVTRSSGGFFFLWTLWALGVVGTCAFILSIQETSRLRRQPDNSETN